MELDHTSHSAIEEYLKCPQRFYLHRVLKVDSQQWLAGPAGSAFHTMTEDYDNGATVRSYQAYLDENLEPGVPYTHSRGEDYDWWVDQGPRFFEKYREWRDATGWEVEAVEEEFRIQPAGLRWPVVGFIDRRFRSPSTGTEIICDIKTGFRLPKDSVQLPIYHVADQIRRAASGLGEGTVGGSALPADAKEREGRDGSRAEDAEGVGRSNAGKVAVNYYNARWGDSTGLEWPTWDEAALVGYISPVEERILVDDWTAKPGTQCKWCPVRKHCSFKKGK